MRIVKWHLEVGVVGADREGVIKVDEDATDEEIEALVREDIFNYISWGWE
jgi:hypothetical protein